MTTAAVAKALQPTPTPESKKAFIAAAKKLPRSKDRAIAFPLGASTFRAVLVDRNKKPLEQFSASHPATQYLDFDHAFAASLLHFGCLPAIGAAFHAGMLPSRGPLTYTNLPAWPSFDRYVSSKLYRFPVEWSQDTTAGFYGVPHMSPRHFIELRRGDHQPGDRYVYAIFGTGMNVGCLSVRQDAHALYAPKSGEERDLQLWLKSHLGHWPDWEDVCAGGTGIEYVGQYFLAKRGVRDSDPYRQEIEVAPLGRRAEVVTKYALLGHPVAIEAATMSFNGLGRWLGLVAVAHEAKRIDVSPGILAIDDIRDFCLKRTQFEENFVDQGRPLFSEFASACTVRVCTKNPEFVGAVDHAASLLRAQPTK